MRAWTILVFIISLQAALVMLNAADPMNVGMGVNIDTHMTNTILVTENKSGIEYPQPNPNFYKMNNGTYLHIDKWTE